MNLLDLLADWWITGLGLLGIAAGAAFLFGGDVGSGGIIFALGLLVVCSDTMSRVDLP